MVKDKVNYGSKGKIVFNNISLDSVTSATDGVAVNSEQYEDTSVFVEVSGNSGAVTVDIEASPTGLFTGEEVVLDTTVYAATNANDVFTSQGVFPYLRVITHTQTTSTVKATIVGRNQ